MNKRLIAAMMTMAMVWAMAQTENTASIQFEKMEHDFGKIDKGSTVDAVFKFKNTGKAPLEIKDVTTSCGCTTAKPEKTVYEPNEEGSIPVTFNSGRFSGVVTKRIRVMTNDPENPRTTLTIKAEIMVDVNVRPASLLVNRFKPGTTRKETISLSTERMDKLEINNLKSNLAFIKPELERVDEKNAKINVTIDGTEIPKGESRIRGILTYETNSNSQGSMRTYVDVIVENPVSVTPSSVFLFGSKQGQVREVVVRLASTEGQTLVVSDLNVDINHHTPGAASSNPTPASYLKAEILGDNEGNPSIQLTLTEDAEVGRFSGVVTMKTNVEAQPEIRIPVRGNVVADPNN